MTVELEDMAQILLASLSSILMIIAENWINGLQLCELEEY